MAIALSQLKPISDRVEKINGSVAGSAIATLLWSFVLTLVFSTLATQAYQRYDQ